MPNLPSERSLHPLSFLFELAAHGRELLLPGIFLLFAGARGSERWQIWAMVLFVPYALAAVVRAFVFRYRLEPEELVLRSGLVFRQVRHVPYKRVQNIDAIQNVLHRLLGVVQVRLETAGGEEPEAKLNVVSAAAFDELRAVIVAARGQAVPIEQQRATAAEPILRLPPGELVKCGLIQGRGLLVIGALFGLLWETGMLDQLTAALSGRRTAVRGVIRPLVRGLFGQGIPLGTIVMTLAAGLAAVLIVTRIFSVCWTLVRLHGFTLRKIADDVRADFGLLTRVAATVPVRRIQSVTILNGPLHRLFDRASVHVDTAGGERDQAVQLQRQWLAPVIPRGEVTRLLREVLPSVDTSAVEWRRVDPRGVRRARFAWLVLATMTSLTLIMLLGWWTLLGFALMMAIGELDARKSVAAMRWAMTDSGVFYRSGWLWRRETIAPFSKIQAVSVNETPFDRRLAMASVSVDTAGTSEGSHRIHVPYLSRPIADGLATQLAAQAARTTFRW
jgi:putative membrane protein